MNHESSLVNRLTDRLIAGELRPGARLSEAALAKEFDVSRNTLREAFRVLGEQGLVDHVPNRGVSVASPSTKAAADAGDWLQVGTANMAFHNGVVALSDSVRLMRSFGHVLAELRLAFLKVELLDFLHAPFVERNEEVYETYLGDGPAAASTLLGHYLGDSERQVLGAYARAGQG